jgi:hypothetical protein
LGGLGFNLTGPGSPNDLIRFIVTRRAHDTAASRRRRVYVIINEHKAVHQVAEADPSALVVYRVHTGPGRAEPDPWDFEGRRWTGGEWVERWLPALEAGIRRDGGPWALGFINETHKRERLQFCIKFNIEMMRACTARGVRCTYLNSAVDNVAATDTAALRVLFDVARDGPQGGHILSANTYWFASAGDDAARRFAYIVPLAQAGNGAPWMHGEVGWGDNDARYVPGDALGLAARHDAAFTGVPGYQGGALWCLNGAGGGWSHSHWQDWQAIAAR